MMIHSTRSFKDSEIRQDPITGKWVVLATARAKKPEDFNKGEKNKEIIPDYKQDCPFCNQEKYPQRPTTLDLPNSEDWRVRVFPNKYPAFIEKDSIAERQEGLYRAIEGVGFHEVVVGRDHNGYSYRASNTDLMYFYKALRDRYLYFTKQPTVNYVQVIENHLQGAGASLEHVHGQIFALPIVPTDEVLDLLDGAEKYYQKNKHCGYCDIIQFEKRENTRVIFENDLFILLAPFAPRVSYEQWILPKEHHSGFERLTDLELPQLVEVVKRATEGLNKGFNDPAYNMYLYSSPCDDTGSYYPQDQYAHFHWQIHIIPRMQMSAGFEMATGVEISTTLPEQDAEYLRKQF
jgi:UDPglucose--hexose-1-phosphate uridylyltransferase